jgi:dipeptidyl aminopeptidase/acylaminoacyl peptidase
LTPGGLVMARLVTGVNIIARSPLTEIGRIGERPVLVVHSYADKRVRVHHNQQLQAAAEKAGVNTTFWYIHATAHTRAPVVYPQEFEERLVNFFGRALHGN